MSNIAFKNTVQFIFLVLLQVLFLNKINLFGYLDPIIYILFVFLYPLDKEKGYFLVASFLLGLSIDIFSNSGGVNAAATLLIAYIRLPILHLIQNKTEFDYLLFNIKKLSFMQAITYIFTLTFIHHLVLFLFEFYKTKNIFSIIGTVAITTLISGIIISFSIQLFANNKKI
jgi:rod shape-determining protein MreD